MSIYKFKIELSRNHNRERSESDRLTVREENFHPKPFVYEDSNKKLIILGSPIYREKIDNSITAKEILKHGAEKSFLVSLNGSFLIVFYDKVKGILNVINDRFASIPFYYFFNEAQLVASVNYADIWNGLYGTKDFTINKEAFYEFIHLQRLLGDKTYDLKTKYLNSASILTFKAASGDPELTRYWRPDFGKQYRTAEDTSRMLADLTARAISRRTGDGKRYGLLLSGGLDSRLVLAAFQKNAECLTVGAYKNNEYLVAKALAAAKKYPHTFIKRRDSHYSDILEEAVFLGGGMNMYVHAHFLDLDEDIKAKADVLFHGHGFDYMFQGKYLPYETLKILNKKTYMKKKITLGRDVEEQFLSGISYRLKSINPLSVVAGSERNRMQEAIHLSAVKVTDEARNCCSDPYDLWEYLIIHNLSRHYTFLNLCSMRTMAEERTVAFDNELFDFYLSLPPEIRLNRKIFTDAIKLLNKELYRIKNANTNFNIYDSDFILTAKISANKILRQFGFGVTVLPGRQDRSWPIKADVMKGSEKMRKIASNLAGSEALDMLGFLDMDAIKLCVEKYLAGKADYSDLILTLVTMDVFMKNSLKRNLDYVGCEKN